MAITDGDWELFDYDFRSGRSVWRYFDGAATHFRTDYPLGPLIEANACARNDATKRFGEGKRVASVPLSLFYDQLAQAQAQGDDRYMSRWLNDDDHRAFKTFGGKL
ncbi:MAG: hypothetical protein V6Z86_10025 [Hyphomicrobiales bacterium]